MDESEKSQDLIVGIIAQFENGTYDPTFNPLDNDYIELVSVYWDTDKNVKEGRTGMDYHYLRNGPKLELCGR